MLLSAGAFLWSYYQTHLAENQASFKLVVIGDNEGVNPTFEQILTEVASRHPDVLVDVGDLTNLGERADLEQVMNRLQQAPYRTAVVMGNNDLGPSSAPDPTNFEQLVRQPTYTSFDIKNVHLVLLDNANRRVGFSDEELAWLAQDLKANTQPHVLLFFHRPLNVPFQNVVGDDETKTSRASNVKFLELISHYQIDHIFNGHLETFLEYDVNGIPVTDTGGAHNRTSKTGFGVSLPNAPHYTWVTVSEDGVSVEKVLL